MKLIFYTSVHVLILLVTGLLAAVLQNDFHVVNYRELLLNDIGDRVAQLLHAELVVHSSHNQHSDMEKQVLVVNTHLIFPHDSSYCFVRLRQVKFFTCYM